MTKEKEEATEVVITEVKDECPECGNDPCTCEEKEKACGEEKTEETKDETKECGEEEDKEEVKAEETIESSEEDSDADEIRSLAELLNKKELGEKFITSHKSYEQFKEAVRNNETNKETKSTMENQKFSLRKALLNAIGKLSDEEASFERSIIEENKRKFNVDADIVMSRRDFNGSEALNQTQYQPGLYTPNLRPPVTVDAIGTRNVTVSGPSISFSVCTSGLNAGFVDINGEVPSATMDFALKTMTPKREGAYVDISYQSLLQDDPSAEGIIMDDITKALDQAKDAAFFNGLSGNNEPVGLLNTTGVNEVTIPSGGAVLSTVLEFEKKIRDSFDYSANLKWVMSPDMYYKWAATPFSALAQNQFLVDPVTRKCIGYDVYVDANLPAGTVILGNFGEALEADFDGIVIKLVEDAALARKSAIEIVAHRALDFLIRRPKSFSKSVAEG